MRWPARWAVGLLIWVPTIAHAEEGVVIERATVPWRELERLLRHQHATVVRPKASAPLSYALGGFLLQGQVGRESARLELGVEVQLLTDRWVEVPLLPGAAAVASAELRGMPSERAVLTRHEDQVVLVARGPGTVHLQLALELPLQIEAKGRRLRLAPLGLTSGQARLSVDASPEAIGGRTRWRPDPGHRGSYEAALGAEGLDLWLNEGPGNSPPENSLEDLEAVTSLALGGSGVTRLVLRATPDATGILQLRLPEAAVVWKLYVGRRSVSPASVSDGRDLRIPLGGESQLELLYTFSGEELGIRGRQRLELPRFWQPIRSVGWNLWLPEGLKYGPIQASLAQRDGCAPFAGRVPIEAQGRCLGFGRPVLGPGAAYVEVDYDQL